ncbi:MAG TPA: class I adenylate-forming enzyme family protein, partial [Thermoleophilaceae bacterium]|nr:class I adenylate-forming enzyme family protein [Thermoleophilaceae bacterium]
MAEAFQATAQQYADRPAIRTKGDEQSYTWGEYAQKVEELARGLAALGLERGQAMGSMLTNRPEFHFFDTAAMHLGATPFSAYNTYTVDQVRYLIQDSEAKVIVTEKAFLDTILAVRDADTPLETVIVVDGDGENDTLTVAEVIEGGDSGFDFEGAWKGVDPDDILTLIYTSGTTGPPKGVQLTHDNIVFAIGGIEDIIQFPDGGRVI